MDKKLCSGLFIIIVLFVLSGYIAENRLSGIHNFSALVDSVKADTFVLSLSEISDSFNITNNAFRYAYSGFIELKNEGYLKNDSLLTIIDFSKPSNEERFFIFDLKNKKLIMHSLVAHGKNSGIILPQEFSNIPYSNKSSLGLYLTGEIYNGRHGRSLRLDGMNEGLNTNARKRAVVIHGASYVSYSYINKNGRLGRSFGCPAVPVNKCNLIIDLIKNGSCIFIYHPSLDTIYYPQS